MLTARQLALRLLRYTGVTQLSQQPEGSLQDSYEPADGNEAVDCINGALQEIHALAPRWFSHRPIAVPLAAPRTVMFTATQGSALIADASPAEAFTRGCTLGAAGGDAVENEIVSATQLLRPFQGASGTISATVYGDCVPLDPGVAGVNPPVILQGYRELVPAASYHDLLELDYRYRAAFGNYGTAVAMRARPRTVAQPLGYYVETFFDPASGAMGFALRFAPMPDGAYTVRFEARLVPRVITLADLGTDEGPDPQTGFGLPNGWDEAVLLPVALQRWTGSSLFSRQSALEEIRRAYDLALRLIVPAMRPQASAPQPLKLGCG